MTRRLLLQHHFAVGVFEAFQLRQERQAEQVFRQRLVRQHHGVDVAHDEAAEFDHGKPRARRLDGAVGGGNGGFVVTGAGHRPKRAADFAVRLLFQPPQRSAISNN
jgi:hypothetical protein